MRKSGHIKSLDSLVLKGKQIQRLFSFIFAIINTRFKLYIALIPHYITLPMEKVTLRRGIDISLNTNCRVRDIKDRKRIILIVHISRALLE